MHINQVLTIGEFKTDVTYYVADDVWTSDLIANSEWSDENEMRKDLLIELLCDGDESLKSYLQQCRDEEEVEEMYHATMYNFKNGL